MVDYNKYYLDNWGLSSKALEVIHSLIIEYNLSRVIEFGSGRSTRFLEDINIDYVSFDDDINYKANFPNVLLRPIRQTSIDFYNRMISGEEFNKNEFNTFSILETKSTQQEYCFYDIYKNDLYGKYDLVILDGPNGNGRSIAFNVIKEYIADPCYIFIDDYTHYPFITHLKNNFPKAELIYSCFESISNCFEIYKIKNK